MGNNGRQRSVLDVGTRIRLVAMADDPDPIPAGATGTITSAAPNSEFVQYEVAWDSPHEHRSLMLSVPPDVIEVIAGS